MVELKEFIAEIVGDTDINFDDISAFFIDNDWFGDEPKVTNGKVMISDEQAALYSGPLKIFLFSDDESVVFERLKNEFHSTAIMFQNFCNEEEYDEEIRFYMADFLLHNLKKELVLYNDIEAEELVKSAAFNMTKSHGDNLTFFMAWLKTKTKTNYRKDFIMKQRYTMDLQNTAYSFDEYIQLLYYLFNAEYIDECSMYEQAAESKNYTDTWLYLSMHFICSLRLTDLERIYPPDLPYSPEDVLEKIKNDTFTNSDARSVILSITTRMCMLPFTPNKTSGTSGVTSVKFVIPHSCEVHMGKLFALAEAHRQLSDNPKQPIIRKISTYSEISRYMGDEIGALFLESDFRSRSATKSYLQAIETLSDDILGLNNSNIHMRGYILAALARSHKGPYGEFAESTFTYLKDSQFTGLTPEFVAFELLERGVLSCIPSMMLNMITGNKYKTLSASKQTDMIKSLNMSPREIESVAVVVDRANKQAKQAIAEVVNSDCDILTALHRIGTGYAFSKEPECLCLLTALNKTCPFTEHRQCIGCCYEISTKSTLLLMLSEQKRLKKMYETSQNELEKNKYKKMHDDLIVPKIKELLYCILETYGEEVLGEYMDLLQLQEDIL